MQPARKTTSVKKKHLYKNNNLKQANLSVENTQVAFAQGYEEHMSLEDESDIPTKNNKCVLHRWIEDDFVFITYYTFDFDLMDFLQVYTWR